MEQQRRSLEVRGLEVRAGSKRLLHGVDLVLHPGELCALIGPSGAGKSTLLKVLLGLRAPSRGSVRLGGEPIAGGVGYVPQEDALHRTLQVEEALQYAAELRLPTMPSPAREARVRGLLAEVGLGDRRTMKIARLSGGQRKRVSVAMELLTRPPLLVLDEPTSGLDPGLEAQMMGLFVDVARAGCVVLVATHAMESLHRADVLMVLAGGCLAFAGSPSDALAFFRAERFAQVFEQLPKQAPHAWAASYLRSEARARFQTRPSPALLGQVA